MFLLVLFLFFVASPVLPSVVLEGVHSCSVNEYFCEDGGCISSDLVCDGRKNCADGSDEASCGIDSITLSRKGNVLNRSKRQTSGCRRNQWPCRDGACIPFDEKCDGAVNCPDGSDETHALCRKSKCQHNWFRCTYGACVDGTAPCNGVSECADSSDELLPRCRNETDDYRGQFRCADGTSIPAANYCDGAADCPDGSDETVRACAAKTCPTYLFQCAYGACVDSGADCNGIQECADGSDEAADLCNKSGSVPLNRPTTSTSATVDRPRPTQGGCVLPDQPAHGSYKSNIPNGRPGDGYDYVVLTVSCVQGYGTVGNNSVICAEGYWSTPVPQCVRMCKLTEHPSVTFTCKYKNENYRACNEYEPSGTVVKPECRYPNYYSTKTLQYMRCIEGQWDYVARCSPECGRVTPHGEQLIIDGRVPDKGEIPWHAGIYTKTTRPYRQICGGSLISTTVVLSAAHCFWNIVEPFPAENYAVGVGKIYRPWDNPRDTDAQKSDVKSIKIPERFRGAQTNFQDDIAIVIVVSTFVYETNVRPVCVDFEPNFEKIQLSSNRMAKVAGWGLTAEDGRESQVLQVLDVPFVDINTCIRSFPLQFTQYITSDKMCAGYKDSGKALCKGDSGGGLAFPDRDKGSDRYYLRGIVSTAPSSESSKCNANVYTTFTQIIYHEGFIKTYWTAD